MQVPPDWAGKVVWPGAPVCNKDGYILIRICQFSLLWRLCRWCSSFCFCTAHGALLSTTVCIFPTLFSVQDSWDTLQCQLGQLAFGSMKLPGMVLFLLVAWLRNTCNLSEKNWWKHTHLFSYKIVDVKLAESASETCLRVWILLWPAVYVVFLNVHAAADHWNKNHISWGRCWREV